MTPAPPAPRIDLEHTTSADLDSLASIIHTLGEDASCRQVVAQRLVDLLFSACRLPGTGDPSCVLVRCFQTTSYAALPTHYQFVAEELLHQIPSRGEMRCLALLATRGVRPVWCDVATSVAHQCIPLPSVEVVKKAPMITRLIQQFGLSLEEVVSPLAPAPPNAELLLDHASRTLNVFHIPEAEGSPFIPAQTAFVHPFGVRSVLGMGGLLPDGEVFAVVLFTRVPLSREVANLFRSLADIIRTELSPFKPAKVFLDREF